jgi:WD40 repeat protein
MIVLQGLGGKVEHLAFSTAGRALLATSWNPKVTAVWRLPEGGPALRFGGFAGVQFGPESESILGVTFNVWNLAQEIGWMTLGRSPPEFTPGTSAPRYLGAMNCLRLSPDHCRVVAYRLGAELFWWSCPGFTPLAPWALESCGEYGVASVAFSPDGALTAVGQHDALTLHETATGRVRWEAAKANAGCVAWSPDGRLLAAGVGKRLRVFDVADGSQVAEQTQTSKYFLDAEFTRDGRFLATVSNEATVKFFETGSWTLQAELAWQVGGLRAITFSGDGMLAAAGGAGKKVVVWDLDL